MFSFVRDSKFVCCGSECNEQPTEEFRITEGDAKRKYLSTINRKLILKSQDYRCIYCEKAFGSIVERKGEKIILQVAFDHAIPFAYSRSSREESFVAACHICNAIKHSFIFRSIEDAQLALKLRREQKGYNF
jgi:5-methylcytosine-specific restriction endonuclease McrA